MFALAEWTAALDDAIKLLQLLLFDCDWKANWIQTAITSGHAQSPGWNLLTLMTFYVHSDNHQIVKIKLLLEAAT